MNATQAENLRVLIRHIGAVNHNLNMAVICVPCRTPVCAIGEGLRAGMFKDETAALAEISTGLGPVFGLTIRDGQRLFNGGPQNAWERADVSPAEWIAEARLVLAENGYGMDDPFKRFMEKVREPVSLEVTASHR